MKLILVRHGQTEQNAAGIVQGQLPGKLTKKGKKQAAETAKKLADEQIDVCYSSDLKRCVDTAEILVSKHPNLEIKEDKLIREISFGEVQGQHRSKHHWDESLPIYERRAPGGESIGELRDRIYTFIDHLQQSYTNETILIVSHGGPIRIFIARCEDKNLEDLFGFELPNAGIWRYTL